ncbi:helix-turn-helix domain-containing protein [Cohnella sp. GbtcB17]|uniref:AraC family transcriptional regulator n=1 Tax=Cohnella sp. GbtcB17 TaxID=2824762 RepID=UPI001C2FF49E|nr:helix-turn-helix domain-containing protein [Cohnella sp. GbtcB17]
MREDEALRDPQLRLLWTARIHYRPDTGVTGHVHEDYYQLLVVLEGEGTLTAGGTEYGLGAGDCCLICPGVRHGFRFAADTLTLDFKFAVGEPRIARFLDRLPMRPFLSEDSLSGLKTIFRLSLAHRRNPRPLLPLRIDTLYKSVLLGFTDSPAGARDAEGVEFREPETGASGWRHETRDDDPFPMAEYLADRTNRQVTLRELAERFNFHPNYIVELFRRRTGTTPIRYHQSLRLAKAKEALEFTGSTVSEIAETLGWSLPYFSRVFLQAEGMPPSAYRDDLKTALGRDIVLESSFVNDWRLFAESGSVRDE